MVFLEANANPSIENMQNEATVRSARQVVWNIMNLFSILLSRKQRTLVEAPVPAIS